MLFEWKIHRDDCQSIFEEIFLSHMMFLSRVCRNHRTSTTSAYFLLYRSYNTSRTITISSRNVKMEDIFKRRYKM